MRSCIRCIIPDSFPNITFHDGVCSFCRQNELSPRVRKSTLGRDKLVEVLSSRKTSDYDCLIPLSGGKDSSYILFYVTKELGLKPLAAFFDNGFVIDTAKRNIERIVNSLGVDLVVSKATEYRRKLIKESLKISTLLPKNSLVGHLCTNCENNLRTFALNEATSRNIPYIVWGATDFEDSANVQTVTSKTYKEEYGTLKRMWRGIFKNYVQVLLRAGFPNVFKLIMPGVRYIYFIIRDNMEMKAPGGWRKLNPFMEVSFKSRTVETIYFFEYIPYSPFEQIAALQRYLGWESPSNHEIRMDCRLHIFGNYWGLRNRGITSDGFVLSTLVRNGLLDREDAVKKEEALKRNLNREYLQLLEDISPVIVKQNILTQ